MSESMRCPKCLVEMEEKGEAGRRVYGDTYIMRFWQCPTCKNIEIESV